MEFIRYDPAHPEDLEPLRKDIALIREKHIQVANQGKLKPKMVCEKLTKRLGEEVSIALHTSAWKYYRVRKQGKQIDGCDTRYCQFDEAHKDYVYTQAWVEFLEEKLRDPVEREKIKECR